MTKAVSRPLQATARAFRQLADQTIKKDPVRAIVELITNSDDSYKKLEKLGLEQAGEIEIYFRRYQNQASIRIRDFAQGMSSELMDQAVGLYGSDTSGFLAGEGGRSFFGRGLKEAILGMGSGFVRSIQNNLYHESVLSINLYEREIPKEATQLYKDKLGINSRGTEISLVIDRQGITIPQFETLKRSLELHYALRDILSSSKRIATLIELDSKDEIKNKANLTYVFPKGDLIINKPFNLPEFETEAVLQIYKASEPLTGREDGYLRQNGILICSKGAIHDIGLFKFENEDLAKNLFGRIICDGIDVLLRSNESILSDSRDGLDWSHPLNKKLRLLIEQELEIYIQEERKKKEETESTLETENTKKRFKKAIDKLNSIVANELKDSPRVGEGETQKGQMFPPNGFDFVPNYYHLLVNKQSMLTLKLDTEKIDEELENITVSTDSPNIEIISKTIKKEEIISEGSLKIIHVLVEGKQIGDEGRVIALLKNHRAEAYIRVVAKREDSEHHRKRKHRGMFKDIKYSSLADPNLRVRYDRLTGTIIIATKAPSVKLYLGLDGEGQDNPGAQVMTAELVVQAFCRELARMKIQSGAEPTLGEPEEFLNSVYNKLVTTYGHLIHSILGPKI